jgi:hypothetical protein
VITRTLRIISSTVSKTLPMFQMLVSTYEKSIRGNGAGEQTQSGQSVAIGFVAGQTSQSSQSVAVGAYAGVSNQGRYSVAMGYQAGRYNQSSYGVAIGFRAGYASQTNFCVAIGYNAGYNADTGDLGGVAIGTRAAEEGSCDNSVNIGAYASKDTAYNNSITINSTGSAINQGGNGRCYIGYIRGANGNHYLHYNSTNYEVTRGQSTSDDRLKYDESFITGAIKSLCKLRPQTYLKKPKLEPDSDEAWRYESGLIAQEVYYHAPELKHIVQVPLQAGDVDSIAPSLSDDPNQDPDYSVWGPEPTWVEYEQFIPYLIKGVQEIVTELPRSKTTVSNTWGQNITGLVVSANTNSHKTNTTPIVTLSETHKDKAWYGVVSGVGTDTNDYDTLIDTKGETRIWVTDVNGSLESGDLVTTSNIAPGYTEKQDDDLIRNYTVAKVTQDCDFTEPSQKFVRVPKKELSNVTYYAKTIETNTSYEEYLKLHSTNRTTKEIEVYYRDADSSADGNQTYYYDMNENLIPYQAWKKLPEDERTVRYRQDYLPHRYEKLDDEEKARLQKGTRTMYYAATQSRSKIPIPEHDEEVVIQEMVDVLDENGQIVWEETTETEPVYTLVDHGTHKAALISCKLI